MIFKNNITYPLFISHCWDYKEEYYTVKNWINESDIYWKDMSIPEHNPKDTTSDKELEEKIENNIKKSSLFIIMAGMYVAQQNRTWINKEIDIANKYNKKIVAIKPWGHERVPGRIHEVADSIVNWQRSSIIKGIKDLL